MGVRVSGVVEGEDGTGRRGKLRRAEHYQACGRGVLRRRRRRGLCLPIRCICRIPRGGGSVKGGDG